MLTQADNAEELPENHEMNVTPFIDVILVLLIIFMVFAPLSTVSMQVQLPSASAEAVKSEENPLILTLRADASMLLNEILIPADISLAEAFANNGFQDSDTRVFIRADKSVSYEQLIKVMNKVRESGFVNIALEALSVSQTGD